jgi:hypothetical protein
MALTGHTERMKMRGRANPRSTLGYFHMSQRTIQQWEQRRAMPDLPARILLKAIEQAPDVIAEAASAVERDMAAAGQ